MIDTFSTWLQEKPSKPAKKKPAATMDSFVTHSGSAASPSKAPAAAGSAYRSASTAAVASASAFAADAPAAAAAPAVVRKPAAPLSSTASGPDNSFDEFCKLCDRIAAEPSHTGKTKLVKTFLTQGSQGAGFTGDTYLVLHLLLPLHPKRVYNMKDKQIVKAFSNILGSE